MGVFLPRLSLSSVAKALAFLLLYAGGYWLTYALSIAFYFHAAQSTILWLANGFTLGVMLVVSIRFWPVLLAFTALLHLMLTSFVYVRAPIYIAFSTLTDTLEPALVAWAIRRRFPQVEDSISFRCILPAIGLVLAGTGLASMVGAVGVCLSTLNSVFLHEWVQWWLADLVGALLMIPVVVGWGRIDRPDLFEQLKLRNLLGLLGLLAATALLANLAFSSTLSSLMTYQFRLAFILFLVSASIYFHPRVIASIVLLATMILVAIAIRDRGPFIQPGLSRHATILHIQVYLMLVSLIALMISALTTERRRALALMRKSEALYRGIVQDQTELICRHRPDFTLTFANEACCRFFNLPCERLIGKSFLAFVHPDDLPRLRHYFAGFSRVNFFNCNEYRVVAPEGGVRWCQWINRAFFDEHGNLTEFQGVGRDVTEIKHADLALRVIVQGTSRTVGEDFFRNLAQQLAQAIGLRYAMVCELVRERPGYGRTLAYWSGEGFAENVEYPLQGTPCEKVYEKQACFYDKDVQSLFPQDEILKSMNAQGYMGIPFYDSAGQPIGHLAVLHDQPITDIPMAESLLRIFSARAASELERLRVEQELRDSSRRKDEFLAMLAHELRNPLAPVRNAVQILRTIGADRPILQRQHEIIDRQVVHMARLLNDLLDVSRITRGKIELQRRPLALIEALTQAVETANPSIEARLQTLHFTPPPASLWVHADYDRLVQIVGNLLNNAAKYTDTGGEIWLNAFREGDQAVIQVRDNGIGIAPEILPRIFDLFTQANRSLDRAQGGLGIGLTLVQRLVQMHGGTIEAHSEGLEKGSEFTIHLPALPEEPAEASIHEGPAEGQEEFIQRRILVVDDVRDTAHSLAELLKLWGHEVNVAYDGPSALVEVRAFHPDIVLLDIGLPGIDGYEVVRRLRAEHGSALKIVALTGYGQEYDRQRARDAGFDEHMVKPVDLNSLKRMLRVSVPR